MSSDGCALADATEEARENRERVMKAVSQNGLLALRHAANELKGDLQRDSDESSVPGWLCSAACRH